MRSPPRTVRLAHCVKTFVPLLENRLCLIPFASTLAIMRLPSTSCPCAWLCNWKPPSVGDEDSADVIPDLVADHLGVAGTEQLDALAAEACRQSTSKPRFSSPVCL